jgi:hypothetical protein
VLRRLALPVLAVAAAAAWPMQGGGSLQNAHYVLVHALGSGSASIDRALGRVGDVATNDIARVDGLTYSNKPPGLAFATLPPFLVLDAARVTDPTRMLWALGLVGVVAPAAALALLVGILGERLAGGGGAVAAAAVGFGTLLLPYATLFVHHALAAFLAFASFALLWHERQSPPRTSLVVLAGIVGGAAVVAEYSGALVAAILAVYAASRGSRLRRLAAWCAGVALGAAPLAVYNVVAFGAPWRTSYSVDAAGEAPRLFGAPSLDVALELLASTHGLLVLTPVLAAGVYGLVRLYRAGARAEALVLLAVPAAYVVFNSAFYSPFGGFSPGPRYLIAAGAFLCVGVAAAWKAAPLVTGALAVASSVTMVLLTATHPQAGYDWNALGRLRAGEVPFTVASLADVTGWYAILPLFVIAAGGLAAALVADWSGGGVGLEPLAAGGAMLGWAALALAAPATGRAGDYSAYVPAVLVVLAAAAATALRPRLPGLQPRPVAR